MKMRRKFPAFLLGGILALGAIGNPIQVKAQEVNWKYAYTGDVQNFVAPFTGIYRFTLNGAQGGHYTSQEEETEKVEGCDGGRGGQVVCCLNLNAGDCIHIYVGGQSGGYCESNAGDSGSGDNSLTQREINVGTGVQVKEVATIASGYMKGGYNGGGDGEVSSGGGATSIKDSDGTLIAIAGGGGGGTEGEPGGAGGEADSGHVELDMEKYRERGESYTISGGAGGGSGFVGGKSGYYYWEDVVHTHTAECYTVSSEKCNGTITYYVKFTGKDNPDGVSDGEQFYEHGYACNQCGYVYASWKAGETHADYSGYEGKSCEQAEGTKILVCTKSTVPERTLRSIAARGGTSWYDKDKCLNVSSADWAKDEPGIWEGDGTCEISLVLLNLYYQDICCSKIYYGGTEVKRIYYQNQLIYQK